MDERLKAVASLVPQCNTFYDVGGGHGLLACALLHEGVCARAVITDVSALPLERALFNARKYGVEGRVELRVCDGFDGMEARAGDAAAVAGMGALAITRVLRGMPHCPVVVQPQRDAHIIRAAAGDTGFVIMREALVRSGGRFYVAMLLERGAPPVYDAAERYVGPRLLADRPPRLGEYIRWRIRVETVARNTEAMRALEEGLRRIT